MQAKLVAFDFDETLYSTTEERLFNAQKLRAVIQGFKKNGIHVVIVSARDSRKSALKALTAAYGENRDFLLVNDIYDLRRTQEVDPDGKRFKTGFTKVHVLDLVVEDHNKDHEEKVTKGNVRFTDDSEVQLGPVEAANYPVYRFKSVFDSNGFSHPEESFLDDFYTFVTGEKLTLGAGHASAGFHALKVDEKTPLVVPGDAADTVESDSCCRCSVL